MRLLTLLLLCLPLTLLAAEHGGAPAEDQEQAESGAGEHGGAPAEEKK